MAPLRGSRPAAAGIEKGRLMMGGRATRRGGDVAGEGALKADALRARGQSRGGRRRIGVRRGQDRAMVDDDEERRAGAEKKPRG